ncbi:MAG: glycosyltransferase [Candidatus Pacebacteria bacterium]|nr:glycosyltransferase [Candidatus Paceibacterota bacterium]
MISATSCAPPSPNSSPNSSSISSPSSSPSPNSPPDSNNTSKPTNSSTSSNHQPFFSIVIPALNEEKYLPPLLNDLANQTFQDFEVIVVDGKSDDQTVVKAKRFSSKINLSVFNSQKRNVGAQRNLGAQKARAEWIIFMDADNRLPDYFLQGVKYQLERHPETDFFSCKVSTNLNSQKEKMIAQLANISCQLSKLVKPIALGSMIGLRQEITNRHQFDETLTTGEDRAFCLQLTEAGYQYQLLPHPAYKLSLRRFAKEGTLKQLLITTKLLLQDAIGKDLSQPTPEYPMLGGGYFETQSVDVLILSSFCGHSSMAQAAKQILDKHNISSLTYDKHDLLNDAYTFIYRNIPLLNKLINESADSEYVYQLFRPLSILRFKPLLNKLIEQYQPKVIITTYAEFIPTLEKIHQKTQLPFINPIANPRSFFSERYEISESAEVNFVFDKKQLANITATGKIDALGWLVRSEFYQEVDQAQVKKQLGLKSQPTILFTSGSEGIKSIAKLKSIVNQLEQPTQLIAAVGNNRKLYQQVQELAQTNSNPNCQLVPLGYTRELHLYMQAADLIVGKAGPNTIFEAAATNTPFLACDYIPGQEDDNFELIEDYNLGWVETNKKKLGQKTNQLITNPGLLHSKDKSIKQLAQYNRQAETKLIKVVKKFI